LEEKRWIERKNDRKGMRENENTCFFATFDFKRQHSTKPISHLLFCQFMLRVRRKSGIVHFLLQNGYKEKRGKEEEIPGFWGVAPKTWQQQLRWSCASACEHLVSLSLFVIKWTPKVKWNIISAVAV